MHDKLLSALIIFLSTTHCSFALKRHESCCFMHTEAMTAITVPLLAYSPMAPSLRFQCKWRQCYTIETTIKMSINQSDSLNSRENEIRKKIMDIKRKQSGKAKIDELRKFRASMKSANKSVYEQYAGKLGAKLSADRSQSMGTSLVSSPTTKNNIESQWSDNSGETRQKISSVDIDNGDLENCMHFKSEIEDRRLQELELGQQNDHDPISILRRNVYTDNIQENEMNDDEILSIVVKTLSEKSFADSGDMLTAPSVALASSVEQTSLTEVNDQNDAQNLNDMSVETKISPFSLPISKTSITGVGGSWDSHPQVVDTYNPSKSGTWGAFPRPKNISVAYGGGRRVGAGVKADENLRQLSIESTKEKLRAYREKMGIEVQSEKDYDSVIKEALEIAGRAMQRGSYGVGVSALEKVTQYCSTRSTLGGKVFLELAMAYEAEGKTEQALALYSTLTKSPIEKIKIDADKLLYGLEAMNFMRNEAKLKEFSRQKVADTFIDATGFRNMASKFDKVYNTAYIDLDKGGQYYRMLTENVVRSAREARLVLLKAVSSGEVERIKIIQALRSISRHFDDALMAEKKLEESRNVLVDYAGKPIIKYQSDVDINSDKSLNIDGFILLDPSTTLEILGGQWRLQLMADRKGDGVDFFNSSLLCQVINTTEMVYCSDFYGSRAPIQTGSLIFEKQSRILSREGTSAYSGGGSGVSLFSFLLGNKRKNIAGMMANTPQQILLVDSMILITRAIVTVSAAENVKDYYSVWRRVQPGTYTVEK